MRIESRVGPGGASEAETWTDHEVVQRMRHDDPFAIGEFYRRFAPALWKEARRAHVQPALRDDLVFDCLGDAAIHLTRSTVAIPGNLVGYLIAALRHRVANDRRSNRRRATAGEAAAWRDGAGERVVRETCSEASIRASMGPAAEGPSFSPVLERLANTLDAGLTDDERQILRWISAWIPQRLIAEWLAITHAAARVRVLRLRDRLMDAALRYEGRTTGAERAELSEFFRRTGVHERVGGAVARPKGRSNEDRTRPSAERTRTEEEQ